MLISMADSGSLELEGEDEMNFIIAARFCIHREKGKKNSVNESFPHECYERRSEWDTSSIKHILHMPIQKWAANETSKENRRQESKAVTNSNEWKYVNLQ